MSNLITLLEKMASDASIQNSAARAALIAEAELTLTLKQALLNSDSAKVEQLTAQCPKIICIAVYPGEDEPSELPAKEQPQDPKMVQTING